MSRTEGAPRRAESSIFRTLRPLGDSRQAAELTASARPPPAAGDATASSFSEPTRRGASRRAQRLLSIDLCTRLRVHAFDRHQSSRLVYCTARDADAQSVLLSTVQYTTLQCNEQISRRPVARLLCAKEWRESNAESSRGLILCHN